MIEGMICSYFESPMELSRKLFIVMNFFEDDDFPQFDVTILLST